MVPEVPSLTIHQSKSGLCRLVSQPLYNAPFGPNWPFKLGAGWTRRMWKASAKNSSETETIFAPNATLDSSVVLANAVEKSSKGKALKDMYIGYNQVCGKRKREIRENLNAISLGLIVGEAGREAVLMIE